MGLQSGAIDNIHIIPGADLRFSEGGSESGVDIGVGIV